MRDQKLSRDLTLHETNPEHMRRRLEVVRFLRESAQHNRTRLMQVNDILEGNYSANEPYASGTMLSSCDLPAQAKEDKNTTDHFHSYKRSFLLRLFVSVVLTASILAGLRSEDEAALLYAHKLRGIITKDYSENLFDFIEKIPYTFEYEKTNVKG